MKVLIILAGYTATGKTYLYKGLSKYIDSYFISPDIIQERIFNEVGFRNSTEKKKIYDKAFKEFYVDLENSMKLSKTITIDYPFSYLQYDKLRELVNKYDYKCITIRLIGDLNKLYERRVKRDMDSNRCVAHMLESYTPNLILNKHERRKYIISKDDFIAHAKLRKYAEFKLGYLIEIDVTDTYADPQYVFNKISEVINETD